MLRNTYVLTGKSGTLSYESSKINTRLEHLMLVLRMWVSNHDMALKI